MMLQYFVPEIIIFKVLRTSGLLKEISTNSVSTEFSDAYGIRTDFF